MELRVERTAFADAVAWTARTLPTKGAGVLNGIVLEAAGDQLILSSYNLDMSSQVTTDATVEAEGQVLVSGRLLVEIARSLPRAGVSISADSSKMLVRCGRSEFVLPLMPQEEYPPLPEMPPSVGRTDGPTFAKAVAQTAIATSRSDTTAPFTTGVRMEIDGDSLTLAATDRYRLAVRELAWKPESVGFQREVIVPGKGLSDVARALAGAKDVSLAMSNDERELGIEADGRRFTTRLLETTFPNFRSLLPTEFQGFVRADTAELTEAIKRVALVAERNMPVRLDVTQDGITLRAGTAEETHATEEVEATLVGPEITIAFNPTFLLDGLSEIDAPIMVLRFNDAIKPAVVTGAAAADAEPDIDYRYLLMPVKI